NEAEDLTQEILVKLLQHDEQSMKSPEAYVFQMASNLLADRARRNRVRQHYREMIGSFDGRGVDLLDPFRIASGRSQLAALDAALRDLPERTRTIFILYRLENLSQDSIAESFGISVSAVKKHVARAVASLAQSIEIAP
ncbi:MAG: RNA polymerase sigma factor, partial [Sphingomonadaceae bacterium]